jgi:glycosyltransferase involved in cell wall biosynthesis
MSSFSAGGTERQTIELVRRLDRTRWDVRVAVFRDTGEWRQRVAGCAPIRAFKVTSFRRASLVRQMRAFAAWCREEQIAIVHTVDYPTNVFGLPAAALARVPVRIGSRRELTAGRSRAALAIQRAAYSTAHVVVANARAACAQLEREWVAAANIALVPNGVSVPPPLPHGTPRRRFRRIVTVANLRPEKGHDVLIDAARLVSGRLPDAHFTIVGGGPERAQLLRQMNEHRLGEVMTFLGHQDDVGGALAEADVFVLPSRSESFPNALLEAMASGVPVVASAVGGVLELVEHGRTGTLVPPGDAQALADSLCGVIAEPAGANAMARAARAHVAAAYSFDRMVAGFDALYQEQLGRRFSRARRRRRTQTARSDSAHITVEGSRM